MTKTYTPQQILALPMEANDADADTIGQYLIRLAEEVWVEGEGFSGKRPFGNSSWEGEVWSALIKADAIEGEFDEYGYIEDCNSDEANEIIRAALAFLLRADWSTVQEYKEPEDWYVVYVDLDITGTPRLQDSYPKGMTKEAAEYAAKECNDDDRSGNWLALHIPK